MTTIKLRRGTATQWHQANPVLAQGEPGFDLDSGVLKVGDGFTAWVDLPGYLTADALSSRFVRGDTGQSWTEAQKQQALDNIGTGRLWTPRQFGPTGGADDTTTFQRAVDSLNANGGGTLWLDEDKYAIAGLIMKSGVVLRSLRRRSMLYPPAGWSGWIIDTPPKPDKQTNMGIQDLLINGKVTDATSPNVGGIQFQNTFACQVSNVAISQTSLGCFKQLAGQATQVVNCGFQNHFEYRTLTANEGALWLLGTDHLVLGCECNGGATRAGSSNGFTEVQYPDALYRCAMLLGGGTIWVYGSNGEYADVGIKITGVANRLIGARGDVNAGPGIVIEGANNSLTNTLVLANSLGNDAAYSHIQIGASAYGAVLDGVMETANFTSVAAQVRYMIDDQVDLVSTPSLSDSLPYIRNVVHQRGFKYRKINQRNVSRSIQPASAGNPVARPPSRYCAGETFYDTKGNQLTVSDGTNWRDAGGALVGNLLPVRQALIDDPDGLGWTSASGSSGVAGVNGWAQFNRPRALELTADGSAGSCSAQTATPVPNVIAGKNYSLVAFHLGVTQTASLAFTLTWLDSGNAPIGSPTTTSADSETATNTAKKYTVSGLTAPAGAAAVSLAAVFTRNGMAAGEAYRITKICLVAGGNPGDFVEP